MKAIVKVLIKIVKAILVFVVKVIVKVGLGTYYIINGSILAPPIEPTPSLIGGEDPPLDFGGKTNTENKHLKLII